MGNCNGPAKQQQQQIAGQVESVNFDRFFNVLTGPELQDVIEAQNLQYRERNYSPPVTLSLFLGQVMSADGSCRMPSTTTTSTVR